MYCTFSEVTSWVFEHFYILIVCNFFLNNVFNNSVVHFELIFVIERDNYLDFQKDGCRLQRWICAVVQKKKFKVFILL